MSNNKEMKEDIQNLHDHMHHFHVLVHGGDGEAMGILMGAGLPFLKAIQTASDIHDDSDMDDDEKYILENLKNVDNDYLDRVVQDGSGFGDKALKVLKGIGKTALKIAPAILPLLL